MADYILVTHWTSGDVYPFIRFGKLLRKEGHKVTILTHCVYEQAAKDAGLEFMATDTPEEYDAQNRDMAMLTDPISKRDDYIRFHSIYHGKERLLREVALIEKIITDDTVIIARFRSSISGMLAAEKHHLPYATMILAPNYFSHMELHDELFGEAFCEEINGARTALGLPEISGWKDWLYSADPILCAWPKWFATADETWAESAEPIGFIRDFDQQGEPEFDEAVMNFLEEAKAKNKKTAIITGGSSRMYSKELYTTAIQACALAGVYAIAVTIYDEYIPQEVPENIMCVRRIPFLGSLMKKVDLVIHHGGMGSINESVDAGVAQIVLPHLLDGPDNADRLEALGIAAKFPPKMWDPALIAKSITEQLEDRNRDICLKYKDLNANIYSEKPWKAVLADLKPYELPPQKAKKPVVTASAAPKAQVSKEMLLKLLKKKQENKG